MRRGPLFYLLMVVLVFRGLVGTAMAAGMLPMQHGPAAIAPAAVADHHGQHGHASATDAAHTADHGSTHGGGHGGTDAGALACDGSAPTSTGCATHSQHANCTACEICHTALMEPPAMPAAPLPLAAGAAPAAATPFDSATAALAIKPPIA
ncbi:hypothetical protein LJR118_002731 [Acidovorax sp. LjRoot118]|uniref:hypothetical protein n=1 Tax=Acidovorax sp. LjRoot118 TaxID=3342256 RepID=UPI003ECD4148